MRLRSLTQLAFRNLVTRQVSFPDGVVAVVGQNASGKSNLLAAAYLGCNGTLASGSLGEMVSFGHEEAYVAVEVEHLEGLSRVEVGLAAGRKVVRLDSQAARAADVARHVAAVLVTPEDSELVHGSPSARRGFLDALISKVSARYAALVREYGRVLEQRNALLRLSPRDASLPDWTERLVTVGTEVDALRDRLVRRLCPLAAEVYRDVSGDDAPFAVRLSRNWEGDDLGAAVAATRAAELARGATVVGPHRDDLELTLGGMDVRSFGSRGEARTAALALRVAEYRLLSERHGEPPVLLVDDFSAELDADRRAYLLSLTAGTPQAIVTGTEPPPHHDALFRVTDGEVALIDAVGAPA
ncbi:MAG TPA: DNA replication and repair protein RecF [Trueperaceae bacterium]|nr:DNA replication and repair protein RecF [Trueperaceae bacterium]